MFENVGKKIKDIAKILFVLETIGAVVCAIVFICIDEELALFALCLPVVVVFAWIFSLLLYCYGDMAEKLEKIEQNTREYEFVSDEIISKAQAKINADEERNKARIKSKRIRTLEDLRSRGLITEEEYVQVVSRGEK